jgi:hypothetical protein
MSARPLALAWPLAGLLACAGCSIFTDLSELTRGTGGAGGSGGTGTTTTSGTGGAATSTCIGPQEFRDPDTGHCYFYDLTGSDDRFSDARSKCSTWSAGADLVVIETAAEASFLFDTVAVQKDTWVGLSDLAVSGTYQWVNGAALTYVDWDPGGFPDDDMAQQQCIAFASSLKWQNAPCSSTKLTLCERP